MREVGFEPTNPCGTGTSSLRFQGPPQRASLTWLGNTSRRHQRTPAPLPGTVLPHTAHARQPRALIGLSHHQTGKTFKPAPARHTLSSAYPVARKRKHGNPPPQNTPAPRKPHTRLGTLRAAPWLRKPGRAWERRMETPQMVRSNTLRNRDRRTRLPPSTPQNRPHHQRRRPRPATRTIPPRRHSQTRQWKNPARPNKGRIPEASRPGNNQETRTGHSPPSLRTCG